MGVFDVQGARQPDEHSPDAADAASSRFRALARRNRSELEELVRRGGSVHPAEVAGGLYRGWNMASAASLLRVGKFFKRFHGTETRQTRSPSESTGSETPAGNGNPPGAVTGENVLARQNALTEPWLPRFGGRGWLPFVVLPPGSGEGEILPRALVISYRAWPGRGALHPASRVTDYLVRPEPDRIGSEPGRPGLLLGASYIAVTGRRFLLEHFLLERTEDA